MNGIDASYFKQYRLKLGFSRGDLAKEFLKAKDIVAGINYEYIGELIVRLKEIIQKLSEVVVDEIKTMDIGEFQKKYIDSAYDIIKNNGLLPKLNNQGRRPEEVFFSWMRGYTICNFFLGAIEKIFSIKEDRIIISGDDDLDNVETFRRTPSADLEFYCDVLQENVRLEIQSGFTGINDIKQHKVHEARRLREQTDTITFVLHFDIFNGAVAIKRIDNIPDNDLNWITRQQMEGQTVFNIDQNSFVWKLTDEPPKIGDLIEDIFEE